MLEHALTKSVQFHLIMQKLLVYFTWKASFCASSKGLFFLYIFRFRNTNRTEVRIRVPFAKTGIEIVIRFWFINQARAGLPWFMSVYRMREASGNPTTRWKALQLHCVLKSPFFFFAETSTFSFLSLSLWAVWKTIFCALAFVEVPPQLRQAQQTLPRLVPNLSHRFSLWRRMAVNTAAALNFLLVTMNTRSKTDEEERSRKITRSTKTRSRSRDSRPHFFELHSRIIFSYFYLFGLKSNHAPFCYHENCSSQMKAIPFVCACSYSGYKPE